MPLLEEGAGNVDVFIAVSPDDETNLMAGLLAKGWGVKGSSFGSEPDYGPTMNSLALMLNSPRSSLHAR